VLDDVIFEGQVKRQRKNFGQGHRAFSNSALTVLTSALFVLSTKKTTEGLLQVVFFFIFNSKKITKFTAKRDEFLFSVEMHRVLIIS